MLAGIIWVDASAALEAPVFNIHRSELRLVIRVSISTNVRDECDVIFWGGGGGVVLRDIRI